MRNNQFILVHTLRAGRFFYNKFYNRRNAIDFCSRAIDHYDLCFIEGL